MAGQIPNVPQAVATKLLSNFYGVCILYSLLPDHPNQPMHNLPATNTSVLDYCNDLTDYCESSITSSGSKIIVGDFNIPINQHKHPDTIIVKDTLDGLNLIDHVDFVTHHMGNGLDTVLITQESTLVSNTKQGCFFSDHSTSSFT